MHTFQTPGRATGGPAPGRRTAPSQPRTPSSAPPSSWSPSTPPARTRSPRRWSSSAATRVVVRPPPPRGGPVRDGPAVEVTIVCPTREHPRPRCRVGRPACPRAATPRGRHHQRLRRHRAGHGHRRAPGSSPARAPSPAGRGRARRSSSAPARATSPSSHSRARRSATLSVGSGDITIGDLAGEVTTKTGSGDVEVGRLDGTLQTKTGSGSLTVRRAESGVGAGQRRQREHHHRRRGGHRRLAGRVHPHRPGQSGARRVRRADGRPAPGRDHRPHRERQPPGAPVMRGAAAGAGLATPCRPTRRRGWPACGTQRHARTPRRRVTCIGL